ncbi:MAG: tRNA (N(6)-L-threonylcarbamoyladenosine(37)-C(2))-methylthiotransferase MtaB [Planctomycetota bacterium]|jgi:threonylcarbamoyladenosine tRNA methylthiotransferase MtaB
MQSFAINTLGCKVNQYESQQIREQLEQFGLHQVQNTEKPDLIVINTCCVTQTASAKSRQCIHKSKKLNPNAATVVCGCLATAHIGELLTLSKNVHLIGHQDDIATALSQIVNSSTTYDATGRSDQPSRSTTIRAENAQKIKSKNEFSNRQNLPLLTRFANHTRAFLKVQDGCDGYCSYCIVPKTRPNVCSKALEAVLMEAQTLVEAGHREIVVTGVFLGAYGQESARRKNWSNGQDDKLADLLEEMAKIPGLARIRLSSLEPNDVTPGLLETFCRNPNIMPHLHLSLQSGSNAILRKMCRQYTAEEFMSTVEAVKSNLDRPAITTDVIVGFPGETEADFRETVDLAKEVGFAKIHVFRFSPRKGTAAAGFQGAVDKRVIQERSRIMRNLDVELGRKFREQFVGETAEILVENDNGQLHGRSERYFKVCVEGGGRVCKKNELVLVKLAENRKNAVLGRQEELATKNVVI